MTNPDGHLPDDLRSIADRLRAERAQLDPLTGDRIKRRVLSARRQAAGSVLRARIATVLTVLGLAAGSGGAFAFASGGGAGGPQAGAAKGQYCPPKSHNPRCRRHHHHKPPHHKHHKHHKPRHHKKHHKHHKPPHHKHHK